MTFLTDTGRDPIEVRGNIAPSPNAVQVANFLADLQGLAERARVAGLLVRADVHQVTLNVLDEIAGTFNLHDTVRDLVTDDSRRIRTLRFGASTIYAENPS